MDLSKKNFSPLYQVKTRDTFEGGTQAFHPEGIFSVPIFGRIGSPEREKTFGYVNLNTTILHPFVAVVLYKLKGLYKGIIEGRSYVKWDPVLKDFVQSDEINGDTGMHFFLKYWNEIDPKLTGSDIQAERVNFLKKVRRIALMDKVLVQPPAYREFQVNAEGRAEENEINDIYRRIVSISNTIVPGTDSPAIDTTRLSLQRQMDAIFNYVDALIFGKGKLIQGSYARRALFNGTRNVLTSMDTSSASLDDPSAPTMNSTHVGVYQMSKAILPVTKYHTLNGWLAKVFSRNSQSAMLIDPVTLKQERVELDSITTDRWTSSDGIERFITSLAEPELRNRPAMVEGYYIGLVYLGPDNTFKVFGDIDELPEGFDRRYVQPMTNLEVVYTEMFDIFPRYPVFITRYPVAGEGSTYPSWPLVRSTTVATVRTMLDENWAPTERIAVSYPIATEKSFFDSMSPAVSRIKGMAADQ